MVLPKVLQLAMIIQAIGILIRIYNELALQNNNEPRLTQTLFDAVGTATRELNSEYFTISLETIEIAH